MKCGHSANATNGKGEPSCVICTGITPLAEIVDDDIPSLEGRVAKCPYCKDTVESSYNLAFFAYNKNSNVDSYYCGCRGWD